MFDEGEKERDKGLKMTYALIQGSFLEFVDGSPLVTDTKRNELMEATSGELWVSFLVENKTTRPEQSFGSFHSWRCSASYLW